MAVIRHAVPGDASAISRLWNPLIRDTGATFNAAEKSQSEIVTLIGARPGAFFVAEATELAGFASFAQFRSGTGYAHSFEHTVVLDAAARGQGLGRRLMDRLAEAAREAGGHVMVAAVSGENAAAIGFHIALGFETVGLMPQVGRKFGRWFDLVLMQRSL